MFEFPFFPPLFISWWQCLCKSASFSKGVVQGISCCRGWVRCYCSFFCIVYVCSLFTLKKQICLLLLINQTSHFTFVCVCVRLNRESACACALCNCVERSLHGQRELRHFRSSSQRPPLKPSAFPLPAPGNDDLSSIGFSGSSCLSALFDDSGWTWNMLLYILR